MTEKKKELKEFTLLNDAMFKALFRSEDARGMVSTFLSLLTGIPKEDLEKASFIGGEIPKKKEYEKGKTADIIVAIKEDQKIIIEMNQYYYDTLFKKNTSYAYSIYTESTKVSEKRYPQIILINVDDFNHFKTKKAILDFKIRDEEGHIESDAYHSIHFILANAIDTRYNRDEKLETIAAFLLSTSVEKLKEVAKGEEELMAAVRKVEDLSTDPEFIGSYDAEEAHEQEKADREAYGRKLGREEGLKQGRDLGRAEGMEQKTREIIHSLSEQKMPISQIATIMKMSEEEVKEFLK